MGRKLYTTDIITSKDFGKVYTPDGVARYLCRKGLYFFIMNKILQDEKEIQVEFYHDTFYECLDNKSLKQLETIIRNIKILDPACGDGNLLLEIFDYLTDIYYYLRQEKIINLDNLEIAKRIITQNLFGVDLSSKAIAECKHRLLLKSGLTNSSINSFNIRQGDAIISQISEICNKSNCLCSDNHFIWSKTFSTVFEKGGFDLVVSNPPWNILKPLEKEFFGQFDPKLTKYNVDKKVTKKIIKGLLKDNEIAQNWRKYTDTIKMQSKYYQEHYKYQSDYMISGGRRKRISGDINLYKVFLERIYEVSKNQGIISIIIPSGFHTDAGTKALRKLIFDKGSVKELLCFENRKGIFPDIHKSFKFDILIIIKQNSTITFNAAFMLNDLKQLLKFKDSTLELNWKLLKRYSPSSLSIIELKSKKDVELLKKLYQHPILQNHKNFQLRREFDITLDSQLFNSEKEGLILYEGKMIEQYEYQFKAPRYWITKENILKKYGSDYKDYIECRLGFRAIAASTNRRTMLCTLLPPNVCCGNSILVTKLFNAKDKKRVISVNRLLYLTGILNSFIFDYLLRLKVTTNINMFIIYEMPVPQPNERDLDFQKIIETVKTAYPDLFENKSKKDYLDTTKLRMMIKTEVEICVARLYGLNSDDLRYILSQFHLKDPIKHQNLIMLKNSIIEKLNQGDII